MPSSMQVACDNAGCPRRFGAGAEAASWLMIVLCLMNPPLTASRCVSCPRSWGPLTPVMAACRSGLTRFFTGSLPRLTLPHERAADRL
jgi:hypothetical protein